jgi:hypothetical protein
MKASTLNTKRTKILKYNSSIKPERMESSMEIACVAPEMVFRGSFAHQLSNSNKSRQALSEVLAQMPHRLAAGLMAYSNCAKKGIYARGALMLPQNGNAKDDYDHKTWQCWFCKTCSDGNR